MAFAFIGGEHKGRSGFLLDAGKKRSGRGREVDDLGAGLRVERVINARWKSSSDQRREAISVLRAAVRMRARIIAMPSGWRPSSSIFLRASPSLPSSSTERNARLSRPCIDQHPERDCPARNWRSTAKLHMPPKSPTVLVAVPLPPSTMARPRSLVFVDGGLAGGHVLA